MSVLVKICGLRDRDMVNLAVSSGADAVGFVFAESTRRITAQDACAAASDVPPGLLRVAVMLHPSTDEWQTVARVFQPDVLQTDKTDFEYLDVAGGIMRWPVIREGGDVNGDLPETFVYEGAQSGKGQRVDWRLAADVASRGQMILAGGLRPGNVAAAVGAVKPYGVDVSSGVESAPGQKDPRKIKAFIDAVRSREKETRP